MTELDPIQQLIRLKRHEQPPAEFVEDFVRTFHQRQRAEMLQQSARGLLWERVNTYFAGLFTPRLGWALASVAAVASVGILMSPAGSGKHDVVSNGNASQPALTVRSTESPEVATTTDERYLIARHYTGGLADESNLPPVQELNGAPAPQGKVLQAGFSLDIHQ